MNMEMDHNHNHDHDHGAAGADGQPSCPMIMVFHGGHCERILWASWVASTLWEFIFSAFGFFVLAFFYEALKFVREYLRRKAIRNETLRIAQEMHAKNMNCNATTTSGISMGCSNINLADATEKPYLKRIIAGPHLVQTLINLVQVVISYLLMLVFMNFNYWLCLAVILGLGLGYFFFGWIRLDAYEHDCCQ